MKLLRSFGIVVCTVLGTASAASGSQTASLPGAAHAPSPMLAVGAFIVAASLWKVLRAAERPLRAAKTTAAPDLTGVIILPEEADRSRELASWRDFVERLQILRRSDYQSAPLLFVRLDGVEETRRRYGSAVADRIVIGTAHRLRAHLRRDDMVVNLLPEELFVLLSGEVTDEDARFVLRRLEAALATPIPSIKRRHAKLVTVTVQLARASFTNGRLHILVDDAHLVDAPLPPVDRDGWRSSPTRPGTTHPRVAAPQTRPRWQRGVGRPERTSAGGA